MTDTACFPKRQLALIYICRFAEPVSFTVHLPFIYFMVRDLIADDKESQVGYYVGLLTSVFSAAQFMSAIPWGLLSDRLGRRPIILIGLASTTVSMLLFGFSTSYAFAITVKFVSGLLDGNIGILKSMIQENTIHCTQEQRARAFSFLQITFGLGSTVGVFLGGSLYNPVKVFPGFFEHHEEFRHFLVHRPAFLPCFAAASISAVGGILGLLFLKETLVTTSAPLDQEQDETLPLLGHKQHQSSSFKTGTSYPALASRPHRSDPPHPPSIDILAKLKKSLTGPVVLICLTYGMVAFQNVFYDTLFIIWSPSDLDQGGIGLDFFQTALILTISGIVTLVTQLIFFHRLVRYFGTLTLYHWALLISIVVFFTQGFIELIYHIPILNVDIVQPKDGEMSSLVMWIVWSVAMVEMIIKTVCQTILMTSSVMLTNDAAPTLDSLGTINGFSMCVAALTRALGPVICGLIWSLSISGTIIPTLLRPYVVWWSLSLVAVGTFLLFQRFKKQHDCNDNQTANGSHESE